MTAARVGSLSGLTAPLLHEIRFLWIQNRPVMTFLHEEGKIGINVS
jgi:hypothetical protein